HGDALVGAEPLERTALGPRVLRAIPRRDARDAGGAGAPEEARRRAALHAAARAGGARRERRAGAIHRAPGTALHGARGCPLTRTRRTRMTAIAIESTEPLVDRPLVKAHIVAAFVFFFTSLFAGLLYALQLSRIYPFPGVELLSPGRVRMI